MTNRMAIVPVEATSEIQASIDHWSIYGCNWSDVLAASPYAGKVSRDQRRAAMVALQNSKWPFMPAAQRSEIIDIVIAAFGLEKAE